MTLYGPIFSNLSYNDFFKKITISAIGVTAWGFFKQRREIWLFKALCWDHTYVYSASSTRQVILSSYLGRIAYLACHIKYIELHIDCVYFECTDHNTCTHSINLLFNLSKTDNDLEWRVLLKNSHSNTHQSGMLTVGIDL